MTNPSLLPLSWDDIERDARILAGKLEALAPFTGILAVTRGGLAPALLVAQIMDIRTIETIGLSSYQDRQARDMTLVKPASADLKDGAGWLVIDDLADTGATFKAVRSRFPQAQYAALYAKPLGKPHVDLYVSDVEQAVWLVFPWEKLSHIP